LALFALPSCNLSVAPAADPPVPAPKADPIRFPKGPVNPQPTPPPDAIATLQADQTYVIEADVECVVISRPAGIVAVSKRTGPIVIRDKFSDGSGKKEERTYASNFIYLVDPIATGRVELLVLPVGGKDTDLKSRSLDVGGIQPPSPDPAPKPKPNPEPVVTPTTLWGVVIIEETSAAVAERGQLFSSKALATTMKAKGYGFRIVDKDVVGVDGQPPADVQRFLDASSGKAYPQAFLVDTKGKTVTQFDLGTNPAETIIAAFKKWGL
jgi:hypothetical protein